MSHINKKKIAKNTLIMYTRLIITLIISLYTSRVILNALGIVDYGIYNVVGGVIVLFTFINSAMANSTQRFLNFEMGKNNTFRTQLVFNTSLKIHFFIAIIILIIAESIGLWWVNNLLVIPENRFFSANIVYQFTILSTLITLITVPFQALIIANEKVSVYGYIGISEALFKLIIAFTLVHISSDKLIVYAFLLCVVQIINSVINIIYCKKHFNESRFIPAKDKRMMKEMLSFSSWSLLSGIASVSKGQGQNMLLNIFFGPAVNAARAVSMTITAVTNQLISGLMTAVNPQIVKTYSSSNKKQFEELLFQSSKASFFLIAIVGIPIILNAQYILELWLGNPPAYSALFLQLVLIDAIIVSISFPLTSSAQATGNVKRFHSYVTFFELLNLPISYLFLKLGNGPSVVYYVTIVMSCMALIMRLYVLKDLIQLPIKNFVWNVILRCWLIAAIALCLYFIKIDYYTLFTSFVLKISITIVTLVILIVTIGLNSKEKKVIYTKIKEKILSQ